MKNLWAAAALLSAASAMGSTVSKITCELVEAPGNYLEYEIATKKVDLVWHMVSHDGSTRIWREPLVGEGHASGYPYNFSACQSVQEGTRRFEYACANFTHGKLEIGETSQFQSKTWINGGFTERWIPLGSCR